MQPGCCQLLAVAVVVVELLVVVDDVSGLAELPDYFSELPSVVETLLAVAVAVAVVDLELLLLLLMEF